MVHIIHILEWFFIELNRFYYVNAISNIYKLINVYVSILSASHQYICVIHPKEKK